MFILTQVWSKDDFKFLEDKLMKDFPHSHYFHRQVSRMHVVDCLRSSGSLDGHQGHCDGHQGHCDGHQGH